MFTETHNHERLNAALLCEAIYKKYPHKFLEGFDFCSIDTLACSAIQKDNSLFFGIATDNQRNTIYIVVRGTIGFKEWDYKLDIPHAFKNDDIYGSATTSSVNNGGIHRGFLSLAERLPIDELFHEHQKEGKRIVLCGHSMGGSVASIATIILWKMCTVRRNEIVCYTFGSPLFCNSDFADELKRSGFRSAMEHWINPLDVVPRVFCTPSKVLLEEILKSGASALNTLIFSKNDDKSPVSIFDGLTKESLIDLIQSCGEMPDYAPVGSINVVVEKDSKPYNKENVITSRPVDIEELLYISNVRLNHSMNNYNFYLMKGKVGDTHQKTDGTKQSGRVEDASKSWKPCDYGLYQAGFVADNDENGIRLEMLGRRLGMLKPLRANDVTVGGMKQTQNPILISNCSDVSSYFIPIKNMDLSELKETTVKISFDSIMPESTMEKIIEVKSNWFQDYESKISTGSVVDLLAHLRAMMMIADDSKTNCDEDDNLPSSAAMTDHLKDAIHKMDDFLQNQIKEDDEKDLVRIFQIVKNRPDQREVLLRNLATQISEYLSERLSGRRKGKNDFFLETFFQQYEEKDEKGEKESSFPHHVDTDEQPTRSFNFPKISKILSMTKEETAASASIDIFLFETALAYIVLKRWKELFDQALQKLKSFWSDFIEDFVIGLKSAFLFILFGGVDFLRVFEKGQPPLVTLLMLYGGGCGPSFVNSISCMLTETFVIGTLLSSSSNANDSLLKQEGRCLQWIEMMIQSSNQEERERLQEGDDQQPRILNVCGEILKKLDDYEERQNILSFVKNYIQPIRTMRLELLKTRVFTVGIMGEPGSGKSTFVSNNFGGIDYQERTAIQQSFTVDVTSESGAKSKLNIVDFPGMNGNDEFAGCNVSNIMAMAPAIDGVLFFTKLNSRCFAAKSLLDNVRGRCKVCIVLTHVDTELQNKYNATKDETNQGDESSDDDDDDDSSDDEEIINQAMDKLLQQKKQFTQKLNLLNNESVMWVPKGPLRLLRKDFKKVLKPHLQSNGEMKERINSFFQ